MTSRDPILTIRRADLDDALRLAELNQQLIHDEGSRNSITLPQLRERMESWLTAEYAAIIAHRGESVLGYALYCETAEDVYLRQLYVCLKARRQGIGRAMVDWVVEHVCRQTSRLRIDVLAGNRPAIAFWHGLGFEDYALTMERNVGQPRPRGETWSFE